MAKREWKKLDTAPKDGTVILLFGRTDLNAKRNREIAGSWNAQFGCWATPTGWQILANAWAENE